MLSKKSFCIAERKFSELYPFGDGFKEALPADAPEIIVHGRRPDLNHVMAERLKETRPCWERPASKLLGRCRVSTVSAAQCPKRSCSGATKGGQADVQTSTALISR